MVNEEEIQVCFAGHVCESEGSTVILRASAEAAVLLPGWVSLDELINANTVVPKTASSAQTAVAAFISCLLQESDRLLNF